MGIAWVIGIAVAVIVEKTLPHRRRAAVAIGAILILFGVALVSRPELHGP